MPTREELQLLQLASDIASCQVVVGERDLSQAERRDIAAAIRAYAGGGGPAVDIMKALGVVADGMRRK